MRPNWEKRKKDSHPIAKYAGALKKRGLRSNNLAGAMRGDDVSAEDAAMMEEMQDAIRGIQRGLDAMKTGKGEPARKVLDRIRARYKIPRSPK